MLRLSSTRACLQKRAARLQSAAPGPAGPPPKANYGYGNRLSGQQGQDHFGVLELEARWRADPRRSAHVAVPAIPAQPWARAIALKLKEVRSYSKR